MMNKPNICAVCSNPPFKQHEVVGYISSKSSTSKTSRSCKVYIPICERCYKMQKKSDVKGNLYGISGLVIIFILLMWILSILSGKNLIHNPYFSISLVIVVLCCIPIYFGWMLNKEIDDRYIPSKHFGIDIPDFTNEPTVWGTNPEFFKPRKLNITKNILENIKQKSTTKNSIQPRTYQPPQYPPPAIPQPQQPQTYPCSTCGQPLRYIQAYQRWYCDTCRKYV